MLPWYEKEAKERESQGGQGKEILPYLTGQARDKLGETLGVSGRYIQEVVAGAYSAALWFFQQKNQVQFLPGFL